MRWFRRKPKPESRPLRAKGQPIPPDVLRCGTFFSREQELPWPIGEMVAIVPTTDDGSSDATGDVPRPGDRVDQPPEQLKTAAQVWRDAPTCDWSEGCTSKAFLRVRVQDESGSFEGTRPRFACMEDHLGEVLVSLVVDQGPTALLVEHSGLIPWQRP